MFNLELKIPPPIIAIFCGIIMRLLSIKFTMLEEGDPLKLIFIIVLILIGLIFDLSALLLFRSKVTTINPMTLNKPSALVIIGIYKITRNSMCLGLLFFLTGWVVYLSNLYSFSILLIFFIYMNKFQIQPEEEILASNFGQAYLSYKEQVRRWL